MHGPARLRGGLPAGNELPGAVAPERPPSGELVGTPGGLVVQEQAHGLRAGVPSQGPPGGGPWPDRAGGSRARTSSSPGPPASRSRERRSHSARLLPSRPSCPSRRLSRPPRTPGSPTPPTPLPRPTSSTHTATSVAQPIRHRPFAQQSSSRRPFACQSRSGEENTRLHERRHGPGTISTPFFGEATPKGVHLGSR